MTALAWTIAALAIAGIIRRMLVAVSRATRR
jgi:hypothetical protein